MYLNYAKLQKLPPRIPWFVENKMGGEQEEGRVRHRSSFSKVKTFLGRPDAPQQPAGAIQGGGVDGTSIAAAPDDGGAKGGSAKGESGEGRSDQPEMSDGADVEHVGRSLSDVYADGLNESHASTESPQAASPIDIPAHLGMTVSGGETTIVFGNRLGRGRASPRTEV